MKRRTSIGTGEVRGCIRVLIISGSHYRSPSELWPRRDDGFNDSEPAFFFFRSYEFYASICKPYSQWMGGITPGPD